MRCGEASLEDGDLEHHGTTRTIEKLVNSYGYHNGCLKKLISYQDQSRPFLRW